MVFNESGDLLNLNEGSQKISFSWFDRYENPNGDPDYTKKCKIPKIHGFSNTSLTAFYYPKSNSISIENFEKFIMTASKLLYTAESINLVYDYYLDHCQSIGWDETCPKSKFKDALVVEGFACMNGELCIYGSFSTKYEKYGVDTSHGWSIAFKPQGNKYIPAQVNSDDYCY